MEQKGDDRVVNTIEKMLEQFMVMEEAVRKGTMSSVMSRTGLTGGDGNCLYQYAKWNLNYQSKHVKCRSKCVAWYQK